MKPSSIALALAATLAASAASAADTVFLSKNIHTGNAQMPVAQSMAVEGNTIVCIAADDSCKKLATSNTEIVDNGDATIMAGFVDTHLHTRLFGQTHGTMLNLFGFNDKTPEDVENAIREWAAKLGPDEWVIGGGFSAGHFPNPTKERLDELVDGRPALISDNTQHNGWYSTKALEILGIDENFQVPKGGYMPLGEDGKPTGHLQEKAHLATGFVEQHKLYSHQKQEESIAVAARMMNEAGVTSALEAAGGSKEGSDDVYVRMAKKGTLNLRHDITGVFWGGHGDRAQDQAMIDELVERREAVRKAMGSDSHEFLTMNTVKFAIDGTPGAYAHMEEAYLDGTSAEMNYGEENLGWIFNELTERGFRLMLHVEGDAAIRKSLDAFEHANETGDKLDPNARHIMTHLDHVTTAHISRMKTLGIYAQLQYHWGDPADEYFQSVVKKNVPQFILDNSFNAHGMVVNSGVEYGAGPDAPTSPIYKPFDGIEIAMTRQSPGEPDSERLPGQTMTLEQALYGYTLGSAKIMHKDDKIGTLEQGKLADIIVLDRDIHAQAEKDVYQLHQTQVRRTYLDGKLVHKAD
ncbi:amidohydrolase [Paraferrimonas sedimenticola]|uniref:Amidohydrolase n=1 Tax=Paraferrimonas sedimenticola TaxID=375674 RepID=A0AA37RWD6_9GAMM|nr:amidohydrolase family protein [Paraferrimonas sedimenticola]GLP96278.1 putative amidohydrolase [Paraferrimonas sedimenticola]